MKYTASSIEEAWNKAREIFPTEYEYNRAYSENAGYNVYTSTGFGVNAWISDLGNRLEVNLQDGTSVNIWIEGNEEELEAERKDITIKAQAEEIAALKAQVAEMAKQAEELEAKIARLEGWTPYELKNNVSQKDYDSLRKSGRALSDDEAKELVAEEFGFAPDKIQIVHEVPTYEINRLQRLRKTGTTKRLPFYGATDWNYVRFNAGGWMYEMHNGELNKFFD